MRWFGLFQYDFLQACFKWRFRKSRSLVYGIYHCNNGICSQVWVSCGEEEVDCQNQYLYYGYLYLSTWWMISQHIATCPQPRLCNASKSWSTSGSSSGWNPNEMRWKEHEAGADLSSRHLRPSQTPAPPHLSWQISRKKTCEWEICSGRYGGFRKWRCSKMDDLY